MVTIEELDKLSELTKLLENINKNKKLMDEYQKKFMRRLYPGEKDIKVFGDWAYDVENFENFLSSEMHDSWKLNPSEIAEYKKCAAEYNKSIQQFENLKGAKYSKYLDYITDYQDATLSQIISEQHIRDIEDPKKFFKKLIDLYGEEGLARFYHDEYSSEDLDNISYNDETEEYEYDSNTSFPSKTYTISDFIAGEEDKIIELITDETLRRKLLESKLKFMNVNSTADITQHIQEYVDGAIEHGHNNVAYLDEHGMVNIESTLANFENLPISKDKNFYAYLATHLDEMNLPFETFLEYVDPDMIDDAFGPDLCAAKNTLQYQYKDEYAYKEPPLNPELLAWLEDKNDKLTSLETEAKTLSETEALREELEGKKGQNIGEE